MGARIRRPMQERSAGFGEALSDGALATAVALVACLLVFPAAPGALVRKPAVAGGGPEAVLPQRGQERFILAGRFGLALTSTSVREDFIEGRSVAELGWKVSNELLVRIPAALHPAIVLGWAYEEHATRFECDSTLGCTREPSRLLSTTIEWTTSYVSFPLTARIYPLGLHRGFYVGLGAEFAVLTGAYLEVIRGERGSCWAAFFGDPYHSMRRLDFRLCGLAGLEFEVGDARVFAEGSFYSGRVDRVWDCVDGRRIDATEEFFQLGVGAFF